jgi:hypothetical protein
MGLLARMNNDHPRRLSNESGKDHVVVLGTDRPLEDQEWHVGEKTEAIGASRRGRIRLVDPLVTCVAIGSLTCLSTRAKRHCSVAPSAINLIY